MMIIRIMMILMIIMSWLDMQGVQSDVMILIITHH